MTELREVQQVLAELGERAGTHASNPGEIDPALRPGGRDGVQDAVRDDHISWYTHRLCHLYSPLSQRSEQRILLALRRVALFIPQRPQDDAAESLRQRWSYAGHIRESSGIHWRVARQAKEHLRLERAAAP
jgi:hypothetical protein